MPGPLIILDSNILFDDPYFRGSQMSRLLAMARRSRVELAVPEVVLLELQRQQRRTISGRVDYLRRAGSKISDTMKLLGLPTDDYPIELPDFGTLDGASILEQLFQNLRVRLQEHGVEILPVPPVSHEVLLDRDLAGRLPFDLSGKGYRDALIWHSILARWHSTRIFEDAYVVTNDDDFGNGDLDDALRAELPFGADAVRVGSLGALLAIGRIAAIDADLQADLEAAALEREDVAVRKELSSIDVHEALTESAKTSIESAIDAMSYVALSHAQRTALRVPREFENLDLLGAVARGDFEWSLYEQLDGETLLGEGSMTAEVELTAEVDKQDAAFLADPTVHVESWHADVAEVTFWRVARLSFDLRVSVAGAAIEVLALSRVESVE